MKRLLALGAFAIVSMAYASSNQAPSVVQTQVINVQVAASGNPDSYASGSCFMRSIWSNRPDAWRCGLKVSGPSTEVYDPCFIVPGSSNLAVCGIQPGVNDNGFTVKISGLPDKPALNGQGYWAMQLADGTYCRVLDIALWLPPMVVNKKGQTIGSYGLDAVCSNNPSVTGHSPQDVNLAGNAILIGSVVQGKVWTAKRIYYSAIPGNPNKVQLVKVEKVQIAKIWQ